MGIIARLFARPEKENLVLKWIAVATAAVMIVVNVLANALPLNGQSTGVISDKYANLFAPAGVTFAIWGVIYALIIGYCLYQFRAVRSKRSLVKEATLTSVNRYFIASSLLNAAWIFTWHFEVLWLSVLVIIGILYCLIRINLILKSTVNSRRDAAWIRAPFSVYFGWLTVATVADVTAWLVSTGWNGFGLSSGTWTVAILIIAAVIGIVTMLHQKDWLYGSVIVWAYAGILLKHLSDMGWNGQYPSVLATLYILLPVLIGGVMYTGLVTRRVFKS